MKQARGMMSALRLAAVAAFTLAVVRDRPEPAFTWLHVIHGLLAAAFVILVFLSLWRRARPLPVVLLTAYAMVALAVALQINAPNGPALTAVFVSIGVVAVRLPPAHSLPVTGAALAVITVGDLAQGREASWAVIAFSVVIYLIAYVRRTTLAARAAEDREAVLAERTRIARDIHDILAHSLSAQLLHLEGARLLLRADRAGEALQRVELARDMAKQGLEETRRAITALRGDVPPLAEAVSALTGEFQAATGVGCELTMAGETRRLDPEAELAIIRTAQEALTNVRRHAPGVAPDVRLTFGPASCSLDVTNELAASPGTPGSGYGMAGMRERAELIGGRLEAGERDGVFRVHLEVPA
ncbi:sensor histidine kinase [Planotetraspora kaengkrachanensis]|uniref:histidine kinase n=1 Tax=Planotetraspora kaengkrachanensis TaxID=575193 RepID=A0A8J3M4M1_9ACTN|nr:histidine kinase [Planotetraspora kaengkrachanensis]GIG79165.1 two-component sensor histidine kinase [Planotetraspora kaengkrachanensis]